MQLSAVTEELCSLTSCICSLQLQLKVLKKAQGAPGLFSPLSLLSKMGEVAPLQQL